METQPRDIEKMSKTVTALQEHVIALEEAQPYLDRGYTVAQIVQLFESFQIVCIYSGYSDRGIIYRQDEKAQMQADMVSRNAEFLFQTGESRHCSSTYRVPIDHKLLISCIDAGASMLLTREIVRYICGIPSEKLDYKRTWVSPQKIPRREGPEDLAGWLGWAAHVEKHYDATPESIVAAVGEVRQRRAGQMLYDVATLVDDTHVDADAVLMVVEHGYTTGWLRQVSTQTGLGILEVTRVVKKATHPEQALELIGMEISTGGKKLQPKKLWRQKNPMFDEHEDGTVTLTVEGVFKLLDNFVDESQIRQLIEAGVLVEELQKLANLEKVQPEQVDKLVQQLIEKPSTHREQKTHHLHTVDLALAAGAVTSIEHTLNWWAKIRTREIELMDQWSALLDLRTGILDQFETLLVEAQDCCGGTFMELDQLKEKIVQGQLEPEKAEKLIAVAAQLGREVVRVYEQAKQAVEQGVKIKPKPERKNHTHDDAVFDTTDRLAEAEIELAKTRREINTHTRLLEKLERLSADPRATESEKKLVLQKLEETQARLEGLEEVAVGEKQKVADAQRLAEDAKREQFGLNTMDRKLRINGWKTLAQRQQGQIGAPSQGR